MRFTTPLFWTLVLALTLGSCKKYEQNGSLFHLRSPEKRILGTWSSVRVQEVGVEADTNVTELLGSNNLRLTAEFRDDETVTVTNIGEDLVYEGAWAFNDDKSILHLDVAFSEPTGPFFLAADTMDYTDDVVAALPALMVADTFFFESGTLIDVTAEVRPLAEQLMSDYTAWTYEGGNPFYNYAVGDDVSASMADFIMDLLNEGLIASETDWAGIISAMSSEYGVDLSYQTSPASISGWSDPNLTAALASAFGWNVDLLIGAIVSDLEDDAVLVWFQDNMGLSLIRTYSSMEKVIDVYWKMLELELDDMQAYQFREFNGEDIYDYSYLLRFEQTGE